LERPGFLPVPSTQGDERMRKHVLVLLALLALLPVAQAMAQTPPAAPVLDTAQFLATLSSGAAVPAQAPNDLTPAPLFMTNCGDGPPCPTGQLCCYLCGNPPADGGSCLGCVTPIKNRCPMVV
jgi:hypothetical protein